MSPGPWRGRGHEDHLRLEADENKAVEDAHERAIRRRLKLDQALTKTRRATARYNSNLEGLRYSLKSLESFRSKVARRESDITGFEAANSTNELVARPDDNELRVRLAWAIRRMTEGSLAVTVYQVRMIASERQQELCRQAAAQIMELAPWDDELVTFARGLGAEVEQGSRWVWQSRPVALTLTICAVLTGIGLAVAGGLSDDIVLLVVGALVSSAALAGVVLAFRRQSWQLTARAAQSVLENPGI